MASPISSTPRIKRAGLRGFTLVEVLISSALASVIFLGVLTTFLMMGRNGVNLQSYTELEAQARKALELFSREVRLAYAVTAYSSTSVSLSIPDTSASRTTLLYSVTYTFDTTNNRFTRTGPPADNPAGTSATTTLISNVRQLSGTNPFNYYRYVTGGGYATGYTTNTAANATEIKQIEINFVAQRSNTTVVTATDKVMSARFIVRNK
jgi:prepilin-type N-terminal cleavage/methylation domain-containing protein